MNLDISLLIQIVSGTIMLIIGLILTNISKSYKQIKDSIERLNLLVSINQEKSTHSRLVIEEKINNICLRISKIEK